MDVARGAETPLAGVESRSVSCWLGDSTTTNQEQPKVFRGLRNAVAAMLDLCHATTRIWEAAHLC